MLPMLFHVVLKSFDCHSANFRKNFRKSYKHFWFLSQFVLFAIFLFGGRIHLSQCMDWLVKKLQWVAKKCGCICGQRPLLFRSSALLSLQKKGQKTSPAFWRLLFPASTHTENLQQHKKFYRATFLATQKYKILKKVPKYYEYFN